MANELADTKVSFSGLSLERHVKSVLHLAREQTERPIDGALLVRTLVSFVRWKQRSGQNVTKAFERFAQLFEHLDAPALAVTEPKRFNPSLLVIPPLGASFDLAKSLISKGKPRKMWGRDFITMVLLTNDDQSLNSIASEVNLTLVELRTEWYHFVTSGKHRDLATWQAWWRAADIPIPEEPSEFPEQETKTKQSHQTEHVKPSESAEPAESARDQKATYLLVWNTETLNFTEFEHRLEEFSRSTPHAVHFAWLTGTHRPSSIGDRAFLMMRGKDHQGLIASGITVGAPKETDPAEWGLVRESKVEQRYWRAPIRWDFMSREPILALDTLTHDYGMPELWNSAEGGVQIPVEIAQRLEEAWLKASAKVGVPVDTEGTGAGQPEIEGTGLTADSVHEEKGEFRRSYAGVNTDRVSADAVDHLGVEDEAKAFARVAASKGVSPPLSIGVFGEWGSGKTFFMEKMRAHVDHIMERTRLAQAANEVTSYHSDIVQIRFNAWHYMESNLWASLVDHIFKEMDNWLHQKEEDRDKVDALYDRLSTARMLKLEAVENLIQARRRRNEAKEAAKQARQELATAESVRNTVSLKEYWIAVKETLGNEATVSDAQRKELEDAAQALGFYDVAGSAKAFMESLRQAHDQAERGRLLLRSVTNRLGSPISAGVLIALLILVPLLVPILVEYIAELPDFEDFKPLFDKLGTATLAVSSILATATGWVGVALKTGSDALKRLNAFQDQLDKALKERNNSEPQPVLQAEQILAQRRKEVEIAEANLESATDEMEQARTDFGGTAFGRLNRFIREKIVNGDYAKHLGIIASIRKDFEQLTAIMADVEREQDLLNDYERDKEAYEEKLEALDLDQRVARGELTQEEADAIQGKTDGKEAPSDDALKFFRRIVLYVDDLDRCPPDKVVEVLQACHLLLFFPLFIVVVAVDARWVSRALVKQYQGLLNADLPENGSNIISTAEIAAGTATPRDYLEKIFQIPYWIRRMHGDASQDYAKELIGPIDDDAGDDGQPSSTETGTYHAEEPVTQSGEQAGAASGAGTQGAVAEQAGDLQQQAAVVV